MNRVEELTESAVICDNPKCDYKEEGVKLSDYVNFLNKPCPKCGDNLLTDEDFKRVEQLKAAVDFVNSMTEEQIDLQLKAKGLTPPQDKEMVKLKVGTHKGFSFEIANTPTK